MAALLPIASFAAVKAAERNERKAARVQQRKAELQDAKSRRRAAAEGKAARAATVAQGTNQGVAGGSSVQGAAGSVQTQTASNIGFAQMQSGFNAATYRLQAKANRRRSLAHTLDTVSDLANQYTSMGTGG